MKHTGMDGISKSQVSHLCEDLDARVQAFVECPIEGNCHAPRIQLTGDIWPCNQAKLTQPVHAGLEVIISRLT